jgi:hypothetical protein
MSMKLIHRTKEGKEMPIATMTDDHLTNMLNLIYKKAKELKQLRELSGDSFKARLYGMKIINDEEVADLINSILEYAAPYLQEAYLRGLEGPRNMLIDIFERNARLEGFDNLPALTSRHFVSDDDDGGGTEVDFGVNGQDMSGIPFGPLG